MASRPWATSSRRSSAWRTGADIGVMNPGGLRDDLIGTGNGPGPVTYREAANVQPFANTLVTTELTGAQVKLLLEQQWQRDPDGNIPSRPFLRLGTSKGFTFTEDSSRAEGDRITGHVAQRRRRSTRRRPTRSSANNFVASGGDNFRALTLGTNKQDTGFTDLQATVDYLDANASARRCRSTSRQHGVGARVPAGPFAAGDTVTIAVDSLSMTGEGDLTDATMAVSIGSTWTLGTFDVTTTCPPRRTTSRARPRCPSPALGPVGRHPWFSLTGGTTGTVATVPVQVVDTRDDSTVSGTADEITWGEAGSVSVTVTPATATGTVELYDGTTKIGEGTLTGDATTIAVPAECLPVGTHTPDPEVPRRRRHQAVAGVGPGDGRQGVLVGVGHGCRHHVGPGGSVSVTVTPVRADRHGRALRRCDQARRGHASSGRDRPSRSPAKALAVGTHSLTLKYLGDGDHAGSQGTVTVNGRQGVLDGVGHGCRHHRGAGGLGVVTVAPPAATGTVELYDGATKLGQGTLVPTAPRPSPSRQGARSAPHADAEVPRRRPPRRQDTVTVTVIKVATTVTGTPDPIQWSKGGIGRGHASPAPRPGRSSSTTALPRLGVATLSGGTARSGRLQGARRRAPHARRELPRQASTPRAGDRHGDHGDGRAE